MLYCWEKEKPWKGVFFDGNDGLGCRGIACIPRAVGCADGTVVLYAYCQISYHYKGRCAGCDLGIFPVGDTDGGIFDN